MKVTGGPGPTRLDGAGKKQAVDSSSSQSVTAPRVAAAAAAVGQPGLTRLVELVHAAAEDGDAAQIARVDQIKQDVESGLYRVDSRTIADGVIDEVIRTYGLGKP